MDITVEYTEKEEQIFRKAHDLKEEVYALEREEYVLRREKQQHTKEYNADYRTPLIASVIATVLQVILVVEILKGGFLIAVVTQVLTLAVVATGIAIYYWRKFFYQNTRNPLLWDYAKKCGIQNYYAAEAEIDRKYDEVKRRLAELKPVWEAKEAEKDAIMEAKYTDPVLAVSEEPVETENIFQYFWQGEKKEEKKEEIKEEKNEEGQVWH